MTAESNSGRRIYLDNAATTWPKCSQAVHEAERFIRDCGATAGRGTYGSALVAERWLEQARHNLSQLIGAASGASIAICNSGTHALNVALWGLLRSGDHVITTSMEHNSVLRPLKHLQRDFGIELSVVDCDAQGFADAEHARPLLKKNTKLIALGHASNVTGRLQDVASWSRLAKQAQVRLLLDASQTLGYLPIDVQRDGIDVLAAAAHKGLRALPGTGMLYVAPEQQHDFRPLMFGGTGRSSEQLTAGQDWPQCVEVGNLNMPGVVSMAAAAAELLQRGSQAETALQQRWQTCFELLVQGLAQMEAITLLGFDSQQSVEKQLSHRVPVLSVHVDGWDVHDLANVLDTSFGIEVRAGWHCAALVHQALGTSDRGGTLRLSPGVSTTPAEIQQTLDAFREILGF